MKPLTAIIAILSALGVTSCDFRSETAKKEMEKFSGSPTPTIAPRPSPTAIDPADIVEVDTALDGKTLTVNGQAQNKTLTCNRYDRVMINASGSTVAINGACRRVIINGSGNQVRADAATEFVLNGTENSLTYARFVNGKAPLVADNRPGNVIDKIAYEPGKTGRPQSKDVK